MVEKNLYKLMSIQSAVVVACLTDLGETIKPEIHKREKKSKKVIIFC